MDRMSTTSHAQQAAESAREAPVRCAILTISDTRTEATDTGGATVARLAQDAGHLVLHRVIVRDDAPAIRSAIEAWLGDPSIDAVLTTGGTGIARRDSTIEVVRGLLTKELEGFGELFRMLSFDAVGPAAMLSRAVGGLVVRPTEAGGDTFIFAMPGSVNAVETAMSKLIGPQLAHLVWERRR